MFTQRIQARREKKDVRFPGTGNRSGQRTPRHIGVSGYVASTCDCQVGIYRKVERFHVALQKPGVKVKEPGRPSTDLSRLKEPSSQVQPSQQLLRGWNCPRRAQHAHAITTVDNVTAELFTALNHLLHSTWKTTDSSATASRSQSGSTAPTPGARASTYLELWYAPSITGDSTSCAIQY